MKKVFGIISILGVFSFIFSFPYKPKPILFIHGRSGNSSAWGVNPEKDFIYKWTYCGRMRYKNPSSDTILLDSITPGHTYNKFMPLMTPYVYVLDTLKIDTSFTKPGDPDYPNKSFMEVINFDYPVGSIDPDVGDIVSSDFEILDSLFRCVSLCIPFGDKLLTKIPIIGGVFGVIFLKREVKGWGG